MADERKRFFELMMPYAVAASQRTGLDPRLIVAQSALETGYGKSAPGGNYFGIKSHGKSGGQKLSTREYVDGAPITAKESFRSYAGPAESAEDYANFLLKNPRYAGVLKASGLEDQITAMGRSGYATDPKYAAKLKAIAANVPMPDASAVVAPRTPYERLEPGSLSVENLPNDKSVPSSAYAKTLLGGEGSRQASAASSPMGQFAQDVLGGATFGLVGTKYPGQGTSSTAIPSLLGQATGGLLGQQTVPSAMGIDTRKYGEVTEPGFSGAALPYQQEVAAAATDMGFKDYAPSMGGAAGVASGLASLGSALAKAGAAKEDMSWVQRPAETHRGKWDDEIFKRSIFGIRGLLG